MIKDNKWLYILKYSFKLSYTYRGNTILWAVGALLNLLGVLLIWYISNPVKDSFAMKEIITYLIIGNIYSVIINSWVNIDLAFHIKSGALSSRLMYPTNLTLRYFVEYIGKSFLAECLIYAIPILLTLPFIWSYLLTPVHFSTFISLILILPISYSIKFCFDFIIGCGSFWLTENNGLNTIKDSLVNFLKGSLVPLFLLTQYTSAIEWQPFAWLLHHPMQIYLEKYNTGDVIKVLGVGVLWLAILYFLSKKVFDIGLKRNESVGL